MCLSNPISKKLLFYCISLLTLHFLSLSVVEAAVFKVSTVPQLVKALSDGACNGEDDTIMIQQGTYVGNFIFASRENNSLTVLGGYSENFSNRSIDAGKTILDANQMQRVLHLSALDYPVDFTVQGVTFQNGFSSEKGGGLCIETEGNADLSNIVIKDNTSQAESLPGYMGTRYSGGGGLFVSAGNFKLQRSVVKNNRALSYGGGILFSNQFSSWNRHSSSVYLAHNIIKENSSTGDAGGGVSIPECYYATIIDNSITGNSSPSGNFSGISINADFGMEFNHNTIKKNTVSLCAPQANVFNNLIAGNISEGEVGGIKVALQKDSDGERSRSSIANNTITGNRSVVPSDEITSTTTSVGGMLLYVSNTSVEIYNNIIWNNEGLIPSIEIMFLEDGALEPDGEEYPVSLHHNDYDRSNRGYLVWNPRSDIIYDNIGDNSGNLDNKDPRFVNSADDDFRLSSTSPCVDAGSVNSYEEVSSDIGNGSRIINSHIDIGAYEFSEQCELEYRSGPDFIQWGCRNGDTFYCIDILDESGNMLYQAAACGEGIHNFSPQTMELSPGQYRWKVWSPSAADYDSYQEGFEGAFTIPENVVTYRSSDSLIQWRERYPDTFYCLDIFDRDWNMKYQAAVCGEGVHGFSPTSLNLPTGKYRWKVWSPSGYSGVGFRGEFDIESDPCDPANFYCVDIFDSNWNLIYPAAYCGMGLANYSPVSLNLPPGFYRWKSRTPDGGSVSCGILGDTSQGSFEIRGYTVSDYYSSSKLIQCYISSAECIDIFDSNWKIIHANVVCGSREVLSFSPENLNLPEGNYYWKASSPIDGSSSSAAWGGFAVQ